MGSLLLLVLPCLAAGVLLDPTSITRTKSPCDGLTPGFCTAKLACAWVDNHCMPHIAWLHVMKCGSSFGTTLSHFANGSLPETAHIPSGENQSDPEDRTTEGLQGEPNFFTFKYPVNRWFKDVFRNPPNPGNHLPITDKEWVEWRNNWFGIFREPASRALSSFNHFGGGKGDVLEWAQRIAGQQASMLSAGSAGMARIRCEFNQTDAPTECKRMVDPDVNFAIQRLEGFAFVGIIEEFDMSVCLFHKMMGSPCFAVEFLNTRDATYKGGEKLEEDRLAQLRAQGDKWDDPVYEAAKRRFWSDVAKFDLKPSVCRDVCPDAEVFKRKPTDEDKFIFPEGFV